MKRFVRCMMFMAALWQHGLMNAQSLGDYTFSSGSDATKWITLDNYTDISGTGSGDSWASTVRSIGFAFPFGDNIYTQFSVNSDGNLRLGSTVTGTGNYTTPFSSSNANTNNPKINFFGCDGYLVNGTHYIHSQLFGDTMLVVEYCLGPYSSTYRNNQFMWQVHLYSNGDVEAVFPASEPTMGATHQMGLCVSSSDGWIIESTGNATHFTSGSSDNWAAANWPAAWTWYRFTAPVISCPKPADVQITSITPYSASLQIIPTGTETEWFATISPAVMGISAIPYTSTTATIPALTPNTTYTLNVQAVCGAGDSSSARTVTFTTPCEFMTLPYTENFDNTTTSTTAATGATPSCWTLAHRDVVMTASNQPQIYYGTTYAHSGSYSLRMYYRGIYAMPGISNVSGSMLSFWLKQTSATYPLVVGVMSNLMDESTFVAIDTIVNTNTSDYQFHEIYFDSYTQGGNYIAFRNLSTANYSYSYNYIDDVELTALPTCLKPNAPEFANITTNSATISWTVRDTNEVVFQLAFGTDPDSLPLQTVYNVTSANASGLNSNTTYYCKVRAICGEGDTSDWSSMTSFKTLCTVASTALFSEDFEDVLNNDIPDCWNMGWYYQATGSGVKTQPYKTATTYKHSGTRAMTLQDQAIGTSSWMSTQQLPIDRSGKYALSVWVYRQSQSGHPLEGLKFWVSSDRSDTTGALLLGEVHRHYGAAPAEAAVGWYNYQFPIETSGNKYIIIEGYSTYGNATYFDDIEVIELPCEKNANYTENFELQDNNMVPLCWDNSASTTTTMNSNPHYVWGTYTYNGNKMMRMHNYLVQSGVATTNSPAIMLDSLNRELVFDYAHHANSGAVYVRISNDGGDTFTDIDTLLNDGHGTSYSDPNTWTSRSISLADYAGDTIILQFYTLANYGNGAIFIDNLQVREVNNCPIPTDVTAQVLTTSSAEVSWEGTASEYVVAYGTGTNPEIMDTIHVFDTTAVINGLNAETYYNFFVKSVCGDNESYWSLSAQVFTGYCQPAPTTIDGQGITRVLFGNGSETVDNTNRPTSSPYYGNYYNMVGAIAAGTIANVDITYQTGYDYGTIIWVDWNNNLTFEGNEVVYVGVAPSTNPTTLNASFAIPNDADTGYYRMRIAGSDSQFDSYTSSITAAAGANPCFAGSYAVAHDYTLHVIEAPACSPVLGVVANNVTNSSADISWSLLDSTQNNFAVAYGTVNDIDSMTVVNATTNNVTITGLTNGTTYYVRVKAICGADDQSEWTNATSFTTELCDPADMCALTVEMTDSYGDGWNGGVLNFVDAATNITVASLTITNGSYQSANVNVCDGRSYNIVWSEGQYDEEVSFDIYNSFGTLILSAEEPMGGTLLAYTANCTQTLPDSVTISATAMPALLGNVTGAGTYAYGDTVTLSAVAMPLAHFTQWSNGDTNSTITYVATEDTAFVAYFAYNPVTVTLVNANPTMGYTTPAAGTYTFQVGDTVNAQAIAFSGHSFSNWTINMGLGSGSDTTNPVMLVVPTILAGQTITVTANFEPNPITVNLSYNDTTMGYTVPAAGIHTFQVGDTMNAMAYANTGYHFSHWTYTMLGMTDTTSINPIAQVVEGMMAGLSIDIVANFEPNQYQINVASNNNALGTVTGSGTYAYNTTATLTATAAANAYFVAWNDGDTNATRTVTVTGDATYTATFALNPVTVNIDVNDTTMGTTNPAPGTHTFNVGTTVEAEAIANEGFRFVSWTISVMGQTMSYEDNPVQIAIPEMVAGMTVNVTANFEEISTYEVSFTNEPSEYYTLEGAGFYAEGENVTVSFMTNDVAGVIVTFNGWLIDGELVSTDAEYTFEMVAENVVLTADVYINVTGIDDVNADNINIYSHNSDIVVRGAENQTIRVFDVVGRMVAQRMNANEVENIHMNNMGVYLIQVGNMPARRVVVR